MILQGHTRRVRQAMWSQDESKILTSSWDDTARIWDAASGQQLLILQGHTSWVNQAMWSQDESKILTSSDDDTARIWDAKSGEELVVLSHTSSVRQAMWSQDESKILTSSDDDTARIWDAKSGEELVVLSHTSSVRQATWSQDESKILTSSSDGMARIWDAKSGEELVILAGHTESVIQATWSQDESKILTSSRDGTARIWDAKSGEELVTLQGHTESVIQATWSRDESKILTSSDDGTVRVWYANMDDLVSAVCHRLSRNLTWDEWGRYMDEAYRPTCRMALIPLNVIEAIQEQARKQVQNGEVITATAQLQQLSGWLQDSGQIKNISVEPKRVVAWQLVEQVRALAKDGNLDEAIAEFEETLMLDLSLSIETEVKTLIASILTEAAQYAAGNGNFDDALDAIEVASALAAELDSSATQRTICRLQSFEELADAVASSCEAGFAEAVELESGTSVTGTVKQLAGELWQFEVGASSRVTITLSRSAGSRLNPHLTVYDANHQILGQNDDIVQWEIQNSALYNLHLTEPGRYFVEAGRCCPDDDRGSEGAYVLEVVVKEEG
ncbi:WD40 repeat domain-containing protein [Chloroflexi bacterium TSY]|nr:WD40 repeat domain-containing protein [Chloroflexi bacterium TSY]